MVFSRRARRSLTAWMALIPIVLAVGACGPTASDVLPAGVDVSVYQPRPDVAKNRMAIQIHNAGMEPITVTGAVLRASPLFEETSLWGPDRTATVAPGYSVDLRIDIPTGANCSAGGSETTVDLTWTSGGRSGSATVAADDPYDLLELLHDAACLTQGIAEVATLTATALESSGDPATPGQLVIAVARTGAPGTVTIDSIHSTTLLNPATSDGIGVAELNLGIVIDRNGPDEIRIPIVPNRCDAHALAEDKVGTRMPLSVTAPDGTTGRLVLSASDDLRMQMYGFYSDYCAL